MYHLADTLLFGICVHRCLSVSQIKISPISAILSSLIRPLFHLAALSLNQEAGCSSCRVPAHQSPGILGSAGTRLTPPGREEWTIQVASCRETSAGRRLPLVAAQRVPSQMLGSRMDAKGR